MSGTASAVEVGPGRNRPHRETDAPGRVAGLRRFVAPAVPISPQPRNTRASEVGNASTRGPSRLIALERTRW